VPSGEQCIHEIIDGYRVQVHIANAKAKVLTHRGIGLFFMLGLRVGHIQIRLAHSKRYGQFGVIFLSAKLALQFRAVFAFLGIAADGIEAHP
jgi:hypothetical protein